jgi:hypothetical protein
MVDDPQLHRTQISRLVCEKLNWRKKNGGLKDMCCRVALLRMQDDGIITLPPPKRKARCGKVNIEFTEKTIAQKQVVRPVHEFNNLHFRSVATPKDASLWNEYIDRYHYLGHKTLPGEQLRYFVYADNTIIALLGFGAAAWKTAPRDKFIGWSCEQRKNNLHLIVNNARFLILPWINSKNLASKILGMASRRIPHDWQQKYKYKPVLLETFVEIPRFTGHCYKTANWVNVGRTKGRGRSDRFNKANLAKKDIWLYPLHRSYKKILCQKPNVAV